MFRNIITLAEALSLYAFPDKNAESIFSTFFGMGVHHSTAIKAMNTIRSKFGGQYKVKSTIFDDAQTITGNQALSDAYFQTSGLDVDGEEDGYALLDSNGKLGDNYALIVRGLAKEMYMSHDESVENENIEAILEINRTGVLQMFHGKERSKLLVRNLPGGPSKVAFSQMTEVGATLGTDEQVGAWDFGQGWNTFDPELFIEPGQLFKINATSESTLPNISIVDLILKADVLLIEQA